MLGLARADALTATGAAGAAVHRGSLDDFDDLRSAAASTADGVTRLAFTQPPAPPARPGLAHSNSTGDS